MQPETPVVQDAPQTPGFGGLGISPKLLDILDKARFTAPTPIQQKSIPVAISGQDVMGIAQTGTGKTLAFGIPMIQRLMATGKKGLVLLPTRELAMQVNESLTRLTRTLGLRSVVVIGGEPMFRQSQALRRGVDIVIATPGRLIDLMEQKVVDMSHFDVAVLDEADRMLDMGFAPQIKRVMSSLPKEHQTLLFSATMPEEIVHLTTQYMKLPVRVEVAPQGTTAKKVTQEIFFVARNEKLALLGQLLKEYKGSVLIFTRTKFGAKKITRAVQQYGETAAEIHSNRSLNQRMEALKGFKFGKYRVLVATDIAARGIDVKGIELVINYDLPDAAADYVHRIGRTGRAGQTGHAISFATPDQKMDVRAIERLIKQQLPIAKREISAEDRANAPVMSHIEDSRMDDSRRSGGSNSRFGDRAFNPRPSGPRPSGGASRPPFGSRPRFGDRPDRAPYQGNSGRPAGRFGDKPNRYGSDRHAPSREGSSGYGASSSPRPRFSDRPTTRVSRTDHSRPGDSTGYVGERPKRKSAASRFRKSSGVFFGPSGQNYFDK